MHRPKTLERCEGTRGEPAWIIFFSSPPLSSSFVASGLHPPQHCRQQPTYTMEETIRESYGRNFRESSDHDCQGALTERQWEIEEGEERPSILHCNAIQPPSPPLSTLSSSIYHPCLLDYYHRQRREELTTHHRTSQYFHSSLSLLTLTHLHQRSQPSSPEILPFPTSNFPHSTSVVLLCSSSSPVISSAGSHHQEIIATGISS